MQIFPRTLNFLPLAVAVLAAGGGAGATFVAWYYFSPKNLQVGYAPQQPVPYSHRLHAGDLGIDCRYCHANVERSQEAMIPPTQTCMGCHSSVKADSPQLEALRESWTSGNPVHWVRVHKVPEHAYFDHSVHLAASVGCVSCHGRIDQMDVVKISEPISMGWCLDCHRNPAPNLRPIERITDMQCGLTDQECEDGSECCSGTCAEGVCQPLEVAEARPVIPPENCSGCHR